MSAARDPARPPRYSPETAAAYVAAIRARVGDRDPLALLAEAPSRLTEATAGLADADARRAPSAGEWSVLQVVRHLADCELVYGYRMRLVVAEGVDGARPPIPGFDQEAWAERLGYGEGTLADALADVRSQRAMTVRWATRLAPDELRRAGVHAERGEESVGHILTLLAGHDLAHEAQIARTRAALGV